MNFVSWLLVGVSLVTLSCSKSKGKTQSTATATYYGDIQPILNQKCAVCHQEGGVNGVPLTNYQDVYQVRALIASDVSTGRMPPGQANAAATPNVQMDTYLSSTESDRIRAWIEAGAPAGTATSVAPAIAPLKGLSRVDATLQMIQPYTPLPDGDDFQWFSIPWPGTTTQYVTGLEVKPGTSSEVHHVLIFVDPNGSQYSPTGHPFSGSLFQLSTGVRNIGFYAPGSDPVTFGDSLGIPIAPGSAIVIQIHYNTKRVQTPIPDQTSLRFSLADTVRAPVWATLLTNPQWIIDPTTMRIPAGEKDVMYQTTVDPFTWPLLPPEAKGKSEFQILGSFAHMHQLGTRQTVQILNTAGNTLPLLNAPLYDFNFQETYKYTNPVSLYQGDQVSIECHWDNSETNQPIYNGVRQPPKDVLWGETSEDEMCISSLFFTVK